MTFLEKYWYWFAAAVIIAGGRWLRKNYPELWWKLQLPCNLLTSGLSIIFGALLLRAGWVVATSGIKVLDRVVLFAIIVAGFVSFLLGNIRTWRDWRREKKRREEESDL